MSDFKDFRDNGYILKRKLFSEDEISKLTEFIERNSEKKIKLEKRLVLQVN